MVEHPRLFIDSLNERQSQSIAKDLRGGPERGWLLSWVTCKHCCNAHTDA
ncbi:MAG: hypothetical protein IPH35_10675 [Rhodoferax sp.]|nr:hypothetical protein [Rhodoferax sp.]